MDHNRSVLPWLKGRKTVSVAVVGDIILDEYLDGDVSRISPEAPVPVVLVTGNHVTAGGAANTALNIQLAGGQAKLFGIWGRDDAAESLKGIFDKAGMQTDGLVALEDRPTVKKTRVTTKHQQMIRIDWEKITPIDEDTQEKIITQLKSESCDAILISDYGKGTLPEPFLKKIIKLSKDKKIPTIVDPKGKDFSRYQGVDLITPNKKEACEALGLDPTDGWSGEQLGRKLQEKYNLCDTLVTMGPKGMVLVPREANAPVISQRPKAKEVFDVSGAGDTVAAIMSLSIASRSSFQVATELASLAAGVVVEKWGTQPISKDELEAAISDSRTLLPQFASKTKIVSLNKMIDLRQSKHFREKDIVFTNGCFDILHVGHVEYLEAARSKGQCLIVGINSDASVKRLKGEKRPILALEHRMRMLASLACVDFVVAFDEDTPAQLIEEIEPDILIKGADYKVEDIVGGASVKKRGGRVETIDLVPGISTSEIIRRVQQQD